MIERGKDQEKTEGREMEKRGENRKKNLSILITWKSNLTLNIQYTDHIEKQPTSSSISQNSSLWHNEASLRHWNTTVFFKKIIKQFASFFHRKKSVLAVTLRKYTKVICLTQTKQGKKEIVILK